MPVRRYGLYLGMALLPAAFVVLALLSGCASFEYCVATRADGIEWIDALEKCQ